MLYLKLYFAVFFIIRFLPVDRGRVSPSPFFFIQTIGYALPFSTLQTRLTDFPGGRVHSRLEIAEYTSKPTYQDP